MNSQSSVASSFASTKSSALRRVVRGASMVEYALLLVAVLIVAGGAYKSLGKKVNKSVRATSQVL